MTAEIGLILLPLLAGAILAKNVWVLWNGRKTAQEVEAWRNCRKSLDNQEQLDGEDATELYS